MRKERFRWLAGLIAAHPERKIVGRTRLQKEVKLLQRLHFPTDYSYTVHFYGPYSEGLHAEIGVLEALGLVTEEEKRSKDGDPYFILHATEEADLPEVKKFQESIGLLHDAELPVLELAATYDMFRAMGADHEEALTRLKRKKPSKCVGDNVAQALVLLNKLGLPSNVANGESL